MLSYFLRRMLLIIPTFLGITLLVFTITRFVPGGPVERMLLQAQVSQNESGRSSGSKGAQALSDEQIEELKAFYGLDKPMLVAYWEWLQKLVVLDLGESTRYYEPVWGLIKDRLPVTAFFGLATFLLSYAVSIPLGWPRRSGTTAASIRSAPCSSTWPMRCPPTWWGSSSSQCSRFIWSGCPWGLPGGRVRRHGEQLGSDPHRVRPCPAAAHRLRHR